MKALKLSGKRRGKILFSLLGILLFVGLLPFTLVAWKLIDYNKAALQTQQQEYQLLLASNVASEVDIHVEGVRAQMTGLSRMLGGILTARGEDATASIRKVLADVADDRFLYLRYTDLRSVTVESSGGGEVPRALEPLFVAEFVKAAEGLAKDPSAGPDTVSVSEPIVSGANPSRTVVLLAAPVVAGGSFRGAVFAVADLQSVWNAVVRRHASGGHGLFMVDPHGRLFASSNLYGAKPGDLMQRSGIVKRFLDRPGSVTETAPFLWSEGGVPEWFVGSYEVTREGWGVFVQAKEGAVYAPVTKMIEDTARWALVAIGLAALAAIVFASTLSTPVNRLAEASRAFARGDFSVRVQVRSRNEIGELAETFNSMASELEEVIRRLKRAAEENNELFVGTARALATAIDAKDPYTRGHSVRVNRYAVILARYHGLAAQEIADIHVASLLHDVGKIGVDDAILKKPAPLTTDEFEVMKQHTVLGAQIMSPIRQMKTIIPGLRSHHERWTGGGYPDNLKGEQIPLMARIIAVADAFDAMTTDRPYQKGMSFEAALARVNELKGVVFDDRVVEAFNRAFRAGEFKAEDASRPAPVPAAVA